MATETTSGNHRWKFFRVGGVDQVVFRDGKDLVALPQLDQKLWVALALPTRGIEFDPRTADLVDTDHDGRIRPPELLAAVKWAEGAFKDLSELARGGDRVALSSVRDPNLLAFAKRLLTTLKKPDAEAITLADVANTSQALAETLFNGDGVVIAESAEGDEATRKIIEEIIAAMGPVSDRSGKPGLNQASLDGFFAQAQAYRTWLDQADAQSANSGTSLGSTDATAEAVAAVARVSAKVDDYFARCRLAAFDPRATAALNREEKDFASLAAMDLSIASKEVAAFPLAKVGPDSPLPLGAGVNPAWADAVETLRTKAVVPLLGDKVTQLSEADWSLLRKRLSPFERWAATRPNTSVEKLGAVRIRELLAGDAKAKVAALIAKDLELEKEFSQVEQVERLVRYQRDLHKLLINSVNFADFYSRQGALFQVGTLFLDGRSCELCTDVADPARHALLAALSQAYLAYCELTRPKEPKRTIVAVFTDGDSDNLMVGRNGVFYDRQGRDWDATITKIVANPISMREAFWSPYKKFVRFIEEQVTKRASAAETESSTQMGEAAGAVINADKTPKVPEPKKLDLGTIALIGTAVGGISALVGGILSVMFSMGLWMPLGLLGLILLISGPSMVLAYLKLRQRNLGPILDANGWAINARAKMNVTFGAALTRMAKLPPGTERVLKDPFEDKRRPWKLYFVLGTLALLGYFWTIGRLDPYLPDPIKKVVLWPEKKSAP
jgi:hypothetical protein